MVVPSIPKSACLSARTSSCAPQLIAERLGGGLALNVAIMYERALGEKSRWYGYFSILPSRGERTLPLFWNADESGASKGRAPFFEALKGTELSEHVKEDVKNLREDYVENVVNGLCVNHPQIFDPDVHDARKNPEAFQNYLEAASLSASRAFFIGDVAGEALVPIADMFNHRTDAESVRVFGADDEEAEVGSAAEEDSDSESVSLTGALEIHACAFVKRGAELFNTFGRQNNASLLHKYGFCERDNRHTTVTLDVRLLENTLGAGKIRRAAKSLGMDLEFEQYFEIDPEGRAEDALLELLREAHRHRPVGSGKQTGRKPAGAEDDPDFKREAREKKVRASLEAALRARLELYDWDEEKFGVCVDPSATNTPAGGGLIGLDAANVLRMSEIAVLKKALDGVVQESSEGKRKR